MIISRIDTVHLVRFVLVDEAARSVALVGDMNGWNAKAVPLAKGPRKGVWSVFVPLVSGRHEYAFVVDGKRWITDPLATVRRDDFGVESSILAAIPSARGVATRAAAGAAAARLEKVLPRAVAERLVAKIAAARADSLPAAALESRALKFAARGIAPKEIERAIGEQAQRMGKAKDLLLAARGRAPLDGEIEAGEEALKRGADGAAIEALAKTTPSARALEERLDGLAGQTVAAHPAGGHAKSTTEIRQAGSPASSRTKPRAAPKTPATTPHR